MTNICVFFRIPIVVAVSFGEQIDLTKYLLRKGHTLIEWLHRFFVNVFFTFGRCGATQMYIFDVNQLIFDSTE